MISPHHNSICAAFSVQIFVKTWNLLFHKSSFLGFKGISFTLWNLWGLVLRRSFSLQDMIFFFFRFLFQEWICMFFFFCLFDCFCFLSILGSNLHDCRFSSEATEGYLRRQSKPDGQVTVGTNLTFNLLISWLYCWVNWMSCGFANTLHLWLLL